MISKNSKTHKTLFYKGLDKDTNPNFVSESNYIDANRVSIVGNGNFVSLENIKGTTKLKQILGNSLQEDINGRILAAFESYYKIGSNTNIRSLTIVTASSTGSIRIFCYDIEANELYLLHERQTPLDYDIDNRFIDGFVYPENGLDILYLTDGYFPVIKIKCEVPLPYTPNFLTEDDLTLFQKYPSGGVQLSGVGYGGSLLSGSYQISYQLININTGKHTGWSFLSNPIHVFKPRTPSPSTRVDPPGITYSGVGLATNKEIIINILLSQSEVDNYTHFRLAVIENIYPEGAVNLNASLSSTFEISDYLSSGNIRNFRISSNLKNNLLPISEIVVPKAAIDSIGTIVTRDNRLIGGNIKYKNLEYDLGRPIIAGGSIIKSNTKPGYHPTSDEMFTRYGGGYFRDEVYRFAISYFDEYGNFSAPSILDMSKIVGNKFSPDYSSSTNLLLNSDFDSTLTNWSQIINDFNWISSFRSYDGGIPDIVASVYIENNNPGDSDVSNILYQSISTVDITRQIMLEYSAIMRPNNTTSGSVLGGILSVVYLDSGLNVLSTQNISVDTAFTFNISPVIRSVSLTIPVGCSYIGFRGFAYNPTGDGVFLDISRAALYYGLSDMKFPKRSDVISGQRYSILQGAAPVNLGLRLENITNHPTWAKGFVILRAKRIENIIFQSPLLYMMPVYGLGSLSKYPEQAVENGSDVNYPDARPMGPSNTYIPQNLFWPQPREVRRVKTVNNTLNVNARGAEEVELVGPTSEPNIYQSLSIVFPDSTMYSQNNKYNFNGNHKLETIDACLLNNVSRVWSTSSSTVGDFLDTSISGTFFSIFDDLYYYDANHSGSKPALRQSKLEPTGYKDFDNLSEGTVLNGKDVLAYRNLVTDGLSWKGIKEASVQRCGVFDLNQFRHISHSNPSFQRSGTLYTDTHSTIPTAFAYTTNYAPNVFFNTIEIVNCVNDLSDNRYGDANQSTTFIPTGTYVSFSDTEVALVKQGISVPKTVEVWGGDCVVSAHTFKISDTTIGVVNSRKPSLNGETVANIDTKWSKAFKLGLTASLPLASQQSVISLPVFLKNADQYLTVYLESKYNGEVTDINYLTDTSAYGVVISGSNYGVKVNGNESNSRVPLPYNYNNNISKDNDFKQFFTEDPLTVKNTKLKSRLVYSDVKIYQSNIEGFDTIRTGNYYDLSETYGKLNKLILVGDSLYGVQESGISFIGVGERVIEATDASQLSVRTGDIIGNVILIDGTRGSKNPYTVKTDGTSLFMVDSINKSVYRLSGKELSIISDSGMRSEFYNLLSDQVSESDIIGIYDNIRKEYWVSNIDGSFSYIFNAQNSIWTTGLDLELGNLTYGLNAGGNLYLFGKDSVALDKSIYSMYTGDPGVMFGRYSEPYVKFVVNPDNDIAKVFDNMLINSNDRLKDFDAVVKRESILPDQILTGVSLDIRSRGQGNYVVQIPRDSDRALLRGLNAEITINWKDSTNVALSSVLTKYRLSENIF